jgi:hypothetical protein
MVGSAPQLGAVREAQTHDGLDAVAHEGDWLSRYDSVGRFIGGRAVRVHAELLTGLSALDQIADWE